MLELLHEVQLPDVSTAEGPAMTYLAIVITLVVVVFLNVGLMIYAYTRVKDREPLMRDQVIGFLLAGPFFFFIDRNLRKRVHNLTRFEHHDLLAVPTLRPFHLLGSRPTNFPQSDPD